jgi:predicted RNA binding protein YcfA (HicA-like mRNA interferase family)
MTPQKLLQKAQASPNNLRFGELTALAEAYGFFLDRVSGSHHIYVNPAIRELVNLQNYQGKAKPYQVRQLLRLVARYNMKMEENR